jgi:hypothetical protein
MIKNAISSGESSLGSEGETVGEYARTGGSVVFQKSGMTLFPVMEFAGRQGASQERMCAMGNRDEIAVKKKECEKGASDWKEEG